MSCYEATRGVYGGKWEVVWSVRGLPGIESQQSYDVEDLIDFKRLKPAPAASEAPLKGPDGLR